MTETIDIRRAADRDATRISWLDSKHSFSFGGHYDPANTHHGLLLVNNDDRVAPGSGFETHPHRDMEIITYVLDGAIAHKDSMGSGSTIQPGNVQRMSAGRGVMHSEFNPRADKETHMLQIWIEPNVTGIAPEYEEKAFTDAQKRGRLQAVVSGDGVDGSMTIHQDVRLYAGLFDGDESATLELAPGRRAWVHVARGSLTVNGVALAAGDAVAISDETRVALSGGDNAEVLVFDLA